MADYTNLLRMLRTYDDGYGLYDDAAKAIEALLRENTFLKSMQRSMASSVPLGELGKMVQRSMWEVQE